MQIFSHRNSNVREQIQMIDRAPGCYLSLTSSIKKGELNRAQIIIVLPRVYSRFSDINRLEFRLVTQIQPIIAWHFRLALTTPVG